MKSRAKIKNIFWYGHGDPFSLWVDLTFKDESCYLDRSDLEELSDAELRKIKSRFTDATLRITGRHIFLSLAQKIRAAGGEVRMDVPDIAKEYQEADMLVAPHAIAGGTKFKMLEAMASGLPIVTTKEGMAGLAALAGTHYLEASSMEEFVAQIGIIWENAKT